MDGSAGSSWTKHLLVVLLAGLSIATGIRIAAGWALRDAAGTLRLYGRGHVFELPLRTAVARRSAYTALRRICELR
ncbi:MAG: hypothetical protein OXL97_00725 [Chloroflexota bacterium]|nr:hypothetical protein [Chloroflexota bacterium]MDE2883667.1 hypothetical protein [Chloroflexota bacterium]